MPSATSRPRGPRFHCPVCGQGRFLHGASVRTVQEAGLVETGRRLLDANRRYTIPEVVEVLPGAVICWYHSAVTRGQCGACGHHPHADTQRACKQCGRLLCVDCYDLKRGLCRACQETLCLDHKAGWSAQPASNSTSIPPSGPAPLGVVPIAATTLSPAAAPSTS